METRSLSTQIWREPDFINLDDKGKLIVLYLLTNDKISVLPAYKYFPQEVALYCSTTVQKLEELIPQLGKFGIYLIDGYVLIEDTFTRAKYIGGKTEKARERQWQSFPPNIRDIIDIDGNIAQSLPNHCSTIDKVVAPINHKPDTINHKPDTPLGYRNINSITPEVVQDIASVYKIPVKFVEDKLEDLRLYCGSKGKTYKDYKDTLMNWCRRDWEKSKSRYRESPKVEIVETHEMTDEERLQAIRNLELAKNSFKKIGGGDSK